MDRLLIDSRENSELTESIINKCKDMNIPFKKEWLEIGDYVFQDVCFEAKSSFDFLQSVINKRLWNQMDNMDRAYDNNLVIVYGSFIDGYSKWAKNVKTKPFTNQKRIIKNKYYGAMGKIILDTDCNLIWCPTEENAAQIIAVVCKMKPINRDIYVPRLIKHKKISTSDLRIDILTTIKGLSESKAKILIKKYGSIMEIGETSSKELQEIDGIGKVLANRIIDCLNSENKLVI